VVDGLRRPDKRFCWRTASHATNADGPLVGFVRPLVGFVRPLVGFVRPLVGFVSWPLDVVVASCPVR
jgi:hypothetical protein